MPVVEAQKRPGERSGSAARALIFIPIFLVIVGIIAYGAYLRREPAEPRLTATVSSCERVANTLRATGTIDNRKLPAGRLDVQVVWTRDGSSFRSARVIVPFAAAHSSTPWSTSVALDAATAAEPPAKTLTCTTQTRMLS